MEAKIEPLNEAELDDFIRTYWAAFEPLQANMIMPMIFRNGPNEQFMEWSRQRIRRLTGGDLASWCFTAKDIRSGEILGVSWWAYTPNPPQTGSEIDKAYREACGQMAKEPRVDGRNAELHQAFFKASFHAEMETVAGRPYMCLRMLGVNPKYHRQGAGTLLLKHGLQRADELGLPVYLDCGVMGKPLYERYGFQNMGDFPLNCLDYGGRSDGRHWLMWRPAKNEQ